MRVLVVCSYRDYIKDGIAPFIKEQVEALRALDIEELSLNIEYYLLHGKGITGYLKEIPSLRKKIREYKPDVIHAHYGLSGLLANLTTRQVPVVTTYHGNDINDDKLLRYSKWTLHLSAWNIFVNKHMMERVEGRKYKNYSLIPCGIDDALFKPIEKIEAREILTRNTKLRMKNGTKYVLFPKMFCDEVKDYPLAKAVIDSVNNEELGVKSDEVELVEFAGYTREESVVLMNSVDALLMTSKMEGSPQVVKEAMACGCPIASVDVGDVAERVAGVDGCYVVRSRDSRVLAETLIKALMFGKKTNGREKIYADNLTNRQIARKLIDIYERVKR